MKLIETRKKISKKDCVIEDYGLAYIGFPLSIKLSKEGFSVLGFETGQDKLKIL